MSPRSDKRSCSSITYPTARIPDHDSVRRRVHVLRFPGETFGALLGMFPEIPAMPVGEVVEQGLVDMGEACELPYAKELNNLCMVDVSWFGPVRRVAGSQGRKTRLQKRI